MTVDNVRVEIHLSGFIPAPLLGTHEKEDATVFSINPWAKKQFDVFALYNGPGQPDDEVHWLIAVLNINPVSTRQDCAFDVVVEGRDTEPCRATFRLEFVGKKKRDATLILESTPDMEDSPTE